MGREAWWCSDNTWKIFKAIQSEFSFLLPSFFPCCTWNLFMYTAVLVAANSHRGPAAKLEPPLPRNKPRFCFLLCTSNTKRFRLIFTLLFNQHRYLWDPWGELVSVMTQSLLSDHRSLLFRPVWFSTNSWTRVHLQNMSEIKTNNTVQMSEEPASLWVLTAWSFIKSCSAVHPQWCLCQKLACCVFLSLCFAVLAGFFCLVSIHYWNFKTADK